jgi:hypothetical protein
MPKKVKRTRTFHVKDLDGATVVFFSVKDALYQIEADIEENLDENEDYDFDIKVKWLTDKQIAKIPEYTG